MVGTLQSTAHLLLWISASQLAWTMQVSNTFNSWNAAQHRWTRLAARLVNRGWRIAAKHHATKSIAMLLVPHSRAHEAARHAHTQHRSAARAEQDDAVTGRSADTALRGWVREAASSHVPLHL